MQLCSSLNILCHCLSLGLEWKLTLTSPMTTAEFSKFSGISTSTASSFTINSSTGIPSPPLALLIEMFPKAHLTLQSRMSGSRWVITLSWLSGSWRCFLYSSSVYSCHLFLITSASGRSIPFLSFIVLIFAWNVPLVSLNFLEGISCLSHSVVFLYFFALITEEGFLIFLCYSLELCIQMSISFLSSLPLASLLFSAICKASSDSHFPFFHFVFLGMILISASCAMSQTSIHSSSGSLSDLIPWLYLSIPLYNHKWFDLGHTWMAYWFSLFSSS